ncbi:MAG: transglutaminase-like domain-containing protein [Candidatus Daviesbacteria bacterium]|nr:transglutaminase-like domain-containing protein [Candidatus Daviesbacteria bacterium]
MIKKISVLIIFLILLVLPQTVFAEGEFATSYDVLYDVSEAGVTTVTEKITLKNLTSQYYANQFKLTIGATQISDIKAADPGGALDVTSEQKDTTTTISVKFNQQVAGLGKSLPWTLSFKSKDFAEKVGKVWEVRVPRISSTTNLEAYNLTLSVPQSFGQPSLISPNPKNQTVSSGRIFLTFDKSQLTSSGISANFGSMQIFDFDLSYHLENKNLVPILTNIALPPDTSFQDVIFQRIDPKPLNVTVDSDGNYLAWYRLNRGQKIDVKVFGSAKLYTNSKVKLPVLDEALRKKYTESQKYWEKDNPQIMSKLDEILGDSPPGDFEGKAKLIFQYVVNSLKYDSGRLKNSDIERLGAVTVLDNSNSAVCMEFTDLFLALSRAAGIPARELNGYAYTENTTLRPLSLTKDVLHAWPEYWNERRGWVMVDPTWENTTGGVDYFNKLDLNHFVFAVKGSSSQEPIPAGSYKYAGQDSHDVKVTLSENDFLGKPQIDVVIDALSPILSGFPGVIKVKVTNTGNAVYPSAPLQISADKLTALNGENQKTGPIPPFGNGEFNFNIRTKSLFDSYKDQIVINIGSQKFTKDVVVKPFIVFQPVSLLIAGISVAMVLIYFVVLGGHIYRKRIKNEPVKKS